MTYLETIEKAIKVMRNGGIILYPTDTIWGIGCDATREDTVEKIYKLKEREDRKSMLVVVSNSEMIADYVQEVPSIAWELLDAANDPLTIIYPGAVKLANNLVSSDKSIGIRVCKSEFCKDLISRFRKPIVSTSANISGNTFPKNFQEIDRKIKTGVDYICDVPQIKLSPGKPSSIIKIGLGNEIKIIRK